MRGDLKNEQKSGKNVKSKKEMVKKMTSINNNIPNNMSLKDSYYHCSFCKCKFTSPQGLGGHISRSHSSKELTIKNNKKCKNKERIKSKFLIKAKIHLCEKYNKNYYLLMKTKQGKKSMKKLILSHINEYISIKKELIKEL